MIPNCILFFTEPYSIWSKAALLTLPAGGYLLWSVAFRRSGIAVWLSFPVIFFCALQIVLLYLFGNSVAATDMFIKIVNDQPRRGDGVAEQHLSLGDSGLCHLSSAVSGRQPCMCGVRSYFRLVPPPDGRGRRRVGASVGADC